MFLYRLAAWRCRAIENFYCLQKIFEQQSDWQLIKMSSSVSFRDQPLNLSNHQINADTRLKKRRLEGTKCWGERLCPWITRNVFSSSLAFYTLWGNFLCQREFKIFLAAWQKPQKGQNFDLVCFILVLLLLLLFLPQQLCFVLDALTCMRLNPHCHMHNLKLCPRSAEYNPKIHSWPSACMCFN